MTPTDARETTENARPSYAFDDAPFRATHAPGLWIYLLVGVLFGIVITKAEVISWFRIQEMFRFEGFKRRWGRTLGGDPIVVPAKRLGTGVRYAAGGTIFGLGWALTGACPGPLFALLGSGVGVISVAILSAMLGTWTYGRLRDKLPH